MEIRHSVCFQHIVHLAVNSCAGRIGAVTYKYEVLFRTLFAGCLFILCCSVETIVQNFNNFFRIFYRVKQGGTYTYFFEQRLHAFYIPAKRLHFHTVNDIGTLHNYVCIAFTAQAEHSVQWCQFLDATCFESADNDAGSECFMHLQFGESLTSFCIDGVNGKRTGVVVGCTEVHHQQGGFIAGFHTCQHIAVLIVSSSMCMEEDSEATKKE